MTRTRRPSGLVLALVLLCGLPWGQSVAWAGADGPGRCAVGGTSGPDGVAQGELVALQPDAGPRSGGTQVTLSGAGLGSSTRVFFGSVGADGCFTGLESAEVVVLGDTAVIAVAPPWPTAAVVSVYAGTACGRLSNGLGYTYLE
ncbi:IPT/TIG domain-containing protein [Streptomyces sp. NPDC058401]|uniref:IPT/TIG domain-containing protein n=1 Tax=Streptomyces sp. NPDC058401 TaxID=3346480 RepID=UPI003657D435